MTLAPNEMPFLSSTDKDSNFCTTKNALLPILLVRIISNKTSTLADDDSTFCLDKLRIKSN